jgi:hypothetical protein
MGDIMNIREKLDDFVSHLNNTMKKPDHYWYDYTTRGSKYFKIIMNSTGHRSVYCFVDKRNGNIFKSAGWRAPAKGVRGSVLITESYANADWSGGWLYKIFGNIYTGDNNVK